MLATKTFKIRTVRKISFIAEDAPNDLCPYVDMVLYTTNPNFQHGDDFGVLDNNMIYAFPDILKALSDPDAFNTPIA